MHYAINKTEDGTVHESLAAKSSIIHAAKKVSKKKKEDSDSDSEEEKSKHKKEKSKEKTHAKKEEGRKIVKSSVSASSNSSTMTSGYSGGSASSGNKGLKDTPANRRTVISNSVNQHQTWHAKFGGDV